MQTHAARVILSCIAFELSPKLPLTCCFGVVTAVCSQTSLSQHSAWLRLPICLRLFIHATTPPSVTLHHLL